MCMYVYNVIIGSSCNFFFKSKCDQNQLKCMHS
uniref:Uncharacterized protein n=1 Tax=Amphimedon queenslandica TaxID=400682 RepID=A0A1X7T5L2_AMPQE